MFDRTLEDFMSLFDQDCIKDGTSLQKIKSWECTEGLLASLKVDPRHGLCDNPETS